MGKEILILVFIAFHLISSILWNLNSYVHIPNKIIAVFKPYMYGLSLWQNWGVFAPDPFLKETTIRITIEKEGINSTYLPKYAKEGMPFIFSRFRKFNDNIISKKKSGLKTAYLSYLCREFSKRYEPEYSITLEIDYKDIPLNIKNIPKETYEPIGDITCA